MKLVHTTGPEAQSARELIAALEARGAVNTAKVQPVVAAILEDVRKRGMDSVLSYARRLDALADDQPLRVTSEEMEEAWRQTAPALREAMSTARHNIKTFAEAQLAREWMIDLPSRETGFKIGQVGQIVRPLGAVGCYVPGGRYPYPSTVLMTVTPAQVAGVKRIVVCSPKPARETLAAAWLSGVEEFYRVGGAQAVGALAYGAGEFERVDKVVGPGNLYVTAAKQMVSQVCGIDMPAGPTEIGIACEHGDPAGIAADLVAQAEHDPEALSVLVTSNEVLALAVQAEVLRQIEHNEVAHQSISAQGCIFVTKTVTEAQTLTNRLAFEHLSVDSVDDLSWIENAGSVFIGPYAPQSMGDYVSGPNHVLPTGRNGRIRGGLSVMDFAKVITVQQYTQQGLREMGPHAVALAEAEGLIGHAESVRVKMR